VIEIRNILVPTDFSDFSRTGLDHAIVLSRWYGSRITVLHVIQPARIARGPIAFDRSEPFLRPSDELLRFVDRATAAGVPVDPVAIQETPVTGILERARTLPADLLVMGTHGRSGIDRWALGSVTEKVLRKAPCPILTISRPAQDVRPLPLFKTIVCAFDFSESATRALDFALSLPQEADARLILLHVLEWLPNLKDAQESLEQDAYRRLREAVPPAAKNWSQPKEKVAAGKAYREILRAAEEESAQLIVQGVQGTNAVDRMFFGSTAHHVVREATCPVLCVRTA
jgi:nucleotide-binding universal stress UspA family protein